jgi:hypothetical protein
LRRRAASLLAIVALTTVAVTTAGPAAVADAPVADPATAASISLSVPSVYPYKDGYRDAVAIRVSASTSDAAPSTSTGSVKVTHSGTVVKSWAISAAAPVTEKWDGRVKSKIAAGHYVVTVTYTNPDASVVSASANVTVSSRRAIAHHWSKTVAAWSAHDSCPGFYLGCEEWFIHTLLPPTHAGGEWRTKTVNGLRLVGGDSEYSPTDYQASSSIPLPSAIKASARVKMSVSGHVTLSGRSGHSLLLSTCERSIGTDDAERCGHTTTRTKSGTLTTHLITLDDTTTRAAWLATATSKATAIIDYFTVHVTYYTLR